MKLTNEKIEEILKRIETNGYADIQTDHIESMCTEILELRKLSEVRGDLEKRQPGERLAEAIEAGKKIYHRDFYHDFKVFDLPDVDDFAMIANPDFVVSVCEELLEFRRLSELSRDLEKRIEEEAHKRFPSTIFGHYRTCFLQSAKWVTPIIRAESKATVDNLERCNEEYNKRLDIEEKKVRSQAAEISELKHEIERFKILIKIADELITNENAKGDWENAKRMRIM